MVRHRKALRVIRPLWMVAAVTVGAFAAPVTVSAEPAAFVGVTASHDTTPPPRFSLAEATAARLDDSADTATLTFDLTHGIESTAFVLADPDRVIIDIPQVDFDIDANIGKASGDRHRHVKRDGLVASYRFGLLSPGRSRIVIDLQAPARIVRSTVEKGGDKYRLTVRLAKTDRAEFMIASRSRTIESARPSSVVLRETMSQTTPAKPTIVIDPGHGGPDNGAVVNGVVEKTVALDFARSLARKLEDSGAFTVVLTRPDDVFIPLSERVRIARAANAALMISIHADTLAESGDVSGATVYTVSDKASDAAAAKVAAKENEADAGMGVDGQADAVDVSDILFDLTRRETRAYSHVFARTLVNYWKIAGHLNKNPQRAAGFRVLKAPDVPSVLLELGYLSNATDAASLTSADWRDKATRRMAEAIVAYFADRHGPEKAAAGVTMPDASGPSIATLTQASAASPLRK